MNKPNILLVMTDTHRTDALGCMGSDFVRSPCLDRLAREGVMFTEAHTASPVCMPARCSIMSGLHTPLHGCIENGIDRFADMPFFTDELKKSGYITIMAGKTHFGPMPGSFDIQYDMKGPKNSRAKDEFALHMRELGFRRDQIPSCEEESLDAFVVRKTIDGIEKSRKEHPGRPFFAFCSIFSPHGPLHPFGKWADMYDPKNLPPPNCTPGEQDKLPEQTRRLVIINDRDSVLREDDLSSTEGSTMHNVPNIEYVKKNKALYYGMASYCDDLIGRLMRYLDDSGLRGDTLVIFTSDHGQQLFDHGFHNKHTFYDESLRIPLIMSQPGVLPSGEKRKFCVGTDLAPTILAVAGMTTADANGFDLYTPLREGKENPRICAVSTLYRSMALVTSKYKLMFFIDDGSCRLYDRMLDPAEQMDRSGDPRYDRVKQMMLEALLSWRCNLLDTGRIRRGSHLAGSVAKRVAAEMAQANTLESETTLQAKVAEIDLASV